MKITNVIEEEFILKRLTARKLLKQYQKVKKYIVLGHLRQVDFKLRKPKEAGIYSFRVNKQFRALCIYNEGELRIFAIDNHQNS